MPSPLNAKEKEFLVTKLRELYQKMLETDAYNEKHRNILGKFLAGEPLENGNFAVIKKLCLLCVHTDKSGTADFDDIIKKLNSIDPDPKKSSFIVDLTNIIKQQNAQTTKQNLKPTQSNNIPVTPRAPFTSGRMPTYEKISKQQIADLSANLAKIYKDPNLPKKTKLAIQNLVNLDPTNTQIIKSIHDELSLYYYHTKNKDLSEIINKIPKLKGTDLISIKKYLIAYLSEKNRNPINNLNISTTKLYSDIVELTLILQQDKYNLDQFLKRDLNVLATNAYLRSGSYINVANKYFALQKLIIKLPAAIIDHKLQEKFNILNSVFNHTKNSKNLAHHKIIFRNNIRTAILILESICNNIKQYKKISKQDYLRALKAYKELNQKLQDFEKKSQSLDKLHIDQDIANLNQSFEKFNKYLEIYHKNNIPPKNNLYTQKQTEQTKKLENHEALSRAEIEKEASAIDNLKLFFARQNKIKQIEDAFNAGAENIKRKEERNRAKLIAQTEEFKRRKEIEKEEIKENKKLQTNLVILKAQEQKRRLDALNEEVEKTKIRREQLNSKKEQAKKRITQIIVQKDQLKGRIAIEKEECEAKAKLDDHFAILKAQEQKGKLDTLKIEVEKRKTRREQAIAQVEEFKQRRAIKKEEIKENKKLRTNLVILKAIEQKRRLDALNAEAEKINARREQFIFQKDQLNGRKAIEKEELAENAKLYADFAILKAQEEKRKLDALKIETEKLFAQVDQIEGRMAIEDEELAAKAKLDHHFAKLKAQEQKEKFDALKIEAEKIRKKQLFARVDEIEGRMTIENEELAAKAKLDHHFSILKAQEAAEQNNHPNYSFISNQEKMAVIAFFNQNPTQIKIKRNSQLKHPNGSTIVLSHSVIKTQDGSLYAISNSKKDYDNIKGFLGKGSYGKVKLAQSLKDHTIIAAKIQTIKNYNYEARQNIIMEESIQQVVGQYLDRTNRTKDIYTTKYYTFSEFISGKNLSNYFANNSVNYQEKLEIILKVLQATQNLHSKGIIHGDLSFNNVMYDPIKKDVNIIDFGFAVANVAPGNLVKSKYRLKFDPKSYYAPEYTYQYPIVSAKTDVYSLGRWISSCANKDPFLTNLSILMTQYDLHLRLDLAGSIKLLKDKLDKLNKSNLYNFKI